MHASSRRRVIVVLPDWPGIATDFVPPKCSLGGREAEPKSGKGVSVIQVGMRTHVVHLSPQSAGLYLGVLYSGRFCFCFAWSPGKHQLNLSNLQSA